MERLCCGCSEAGLACKSEIEFSHTSGFLDSWEITGSRNFLVLSAVGDSGDELSGVMWVTEFMRGGGVGRLESTEVREEDRGGGGGTSAPVETER